MDFLKLLNSSDFVVNVTILKHRATMHELYYKVAVEIEDKSRFFAREYVTKQTRDYSFHWQDQNNRLIIRWDNVEHHKHLKTFYSTRLFLNYCIFS